MSKLSDRLRAAALACVGLAAANAHATDLVGEVATLASEVANETLLDEKLTSILLYDPVYLLQAQQMYEVIDLEEYTDPSTVSIRLTEGAILLRDPSQTGEFVRYRYEHEDGRWIRHPDGRYLVTNWYRTGDGRLSKIVRNEDGEGVGTYTIDPEHGGYELNLDLDGDRVVDVMDSVTGDGHEQMMMTALGRGWVELFREGYNALCYNVANGGISGISGFGDSADDRTSLGGCRLSRASQAGGFAGSLGHPEDTPIDKLCDRLSSGDSSAIGELRAHLEGGVYANFDECVDQCTVDMVVCAGACATRGWGNPYAVGACIVFCGIKTLVCDAHCASTVDSEGTTEVPPEPEPAPPPPAPANSSRYHDTDGDGQVDSEDTDGDDIPDMSCPTAGCVSEAYPNPFDDFGGENWDSLCRDSKSGLDELSEMEADAADCPDAWTNPPLDKDGFEGRYAACFAPPELEDVDSAIRDTSSTKCETPRGCEPDIRSSIRSRFLLLNDATMSFFADCGDDLACQPTF